MGSTIHYQPPVFSPQPHIGYAKETGLCRSADFPAELTELGVPVNVVVFHDNLLLAVGFCCWRLYAIRRLFFFKAIITFLFTTCGSIFFSYFNI